MINPLAVVRDHHFRRGPDRRFHLRVSQAAWLVLSGGAGLGTLAVTPSPRIIVWSVFAIFAATILSAALSTTATTRALLARHSPGQATDGPLLNALDDNQNHLAYSGLVGVLVLASAFLPAHQSFLPWVYAITTGGAVYVTLLAVIGVHRFRALTLRLTDQSSGRFARNQG